MLPVNASSTEIFFWHSLQRMMMAISAFLPGLFDGFLHGTAGIGRQQQDLR